MSVSCHFILTNVTVERYSALFDHFLSSEHNDTIPQSRINTDYYFSIFDG
jgi:hypothetical protein